MGSVGGTSNDGEDRVGHVEQIDVDAMPLLGGIHLLPHIAHGRALEDDSEDICDSLGDDDAEHDDHHTAEDGVRGQAEVQGKARGFDEGKSEVVGERACPDCLYPLSVTIYFSAGVKRTWRYGTM